MRHAPLYVMALVIGLVLSPVVAFLCWGPVGPLTNHGTHDFDGIFPLYIFAGTWVLVLSWRLGPRLGAFKPSVMTNSADRFLTDRKMNHHLRRTLKVQTQCSESTTQIWRMR